MNHHERDTLPPGMVQIPDSLELPSLTGDGDGGVAFARAGKGNVRFRIKVLRRSNVNEKKVSFIA